MLCYRGQLQAAQSRYQAQRQITQVLEKEMLELYSWLEREGVPQKPGAASCSTGAGGGETEACMPTDSSAKSFLGMRARELFRNKSESQCDDNDGPRLASLAQSLKTDQCVEPSAAEGVGQGQGQGRGLPAKEEQTAGQQRANHRERQRQQQLRIMDYNEAHHEHS
ncbi:Hamartin [Acipenser ruthenus]|uniref:Hamartin n=1 Tax=Acipenser ruthenus TaxID=7906 RepID=A0A444UYH6_ACIRT|nr:Hamartin [Acipenser ruthenus]